MPVSFSVIPDGEGSPVVIHVPLSSRLIPPDIRTDPMLTDEELAAELDEATDPATDEIAIAALAHVRVRRTIVINHLSRLVIDPERFPDSDPAEAFGRGVVYAPDLLRGAAARRTLSTSSGTDRGVFPSLRRRRHHHWCLESHRGSSTMAQHDRGQ